MVFTNRCQGLQVNWKLNKLKSGAMRRSSDCHREGDRSVDNMMVQIGYVLRILFCWNLRFDDWNRTPQPVERGGDSNASDRGTGLGFDDDSVQVRLF